MKGYKGFDKDLKCMGFQYEVGKEYEEEIEPSVCEKGFHFCKELKDVHGYYNLRDSRICEVEALGKVVTDDNKCATDKIKIVRELSRDEITSLANSGKENTGFINSGNRNSGDFNSGDFNSGNRNSGNRNSGNRNSGNRNSGDRNSGNRNSGDFNSGNRNSGNRNSGNRNSGNRNSGNRNSGNRNSGDFNSGDFCSSNGSAGLFMTKRISYEAFNKSLKEAEYRELVNSEGYNVCHNFGLVRYRVRTKTGKFGDFRYLSYKSSWKVFWNSLTFVERCAVRNMPHLDKAVFEEITGVKL